MNSPLADPSGPQAITGGEQGPEVEVESEDPPRPLGLTGVDQEPTGVAHRHDPAKGGLLEGAPEALP